MNEIETLYREWRGQDAGRVERLAGSGSNRCYYRLCDADGHSVIGVTGTSVEENETFVYLARHFRKSGLPVPEVLCMSDDRRCYLQEDLGNTSLFDTIADGRKKGGYYGEHELTLLADAMRLLPHVQIVGARGLDWSRCYQQSEMNVKSAMFDLNYFKYCFLKPAGVDFDELKLERDFEKFAIELTKEQGEYFLYRDFQARNVMLHEGKPFLIDFQGGRKGAFYYDVASFLWQASARYPDELRRRLTDVYYDELKKLTSVPPRDEFDSRLRLFVLFRTLQVLGAYGYRGWFERKPHFLSSIPNAIENLQSLIQDRVADDYPYLKDVLTRLVACMNKGEKHIDGSNSSLVVRVFSFSYKRGIPEDESGNGGGYVFDCRSTHNPGRYDRYKTLTGLDQPVIKFLEDDGEILTFMESVCRLADKHVERYMERGFTALMFSFGCTGGQHRSVYCAQHLAEYLHRKYGIEVRLCHREQGISQVFSQHGRTSTE